jgi:hypothetical protein
VVLPSNRRTEVPINDDSIADRIREAELAAFKQEYSELSSTWRDLDSKAQGTAGIAGLFVAGTFAFVRTLSEQSSAPFKALLALIMIMLAVTIILAIRALLVRSFKPAPGGSKFKRWKELLLPTEAREPMWRPLIPHVQSGIDTSAPLTQQDYVDFLAEQTKAWERAVDSIDRVTARKADLVSHAQTWLLLGCTTAALTTVLAIIFGGL